MTDMTINPHKPCNSLYVQANLVIPERGQHD